MLTLSLDCSQSWQAGNVGFGSGVCWHDYFLRGRNFAYVGGNSQCLCGIHPPFNHCERNGAEFEVTGRRGNGANNFLTKADFCAGLGQCALRTIEVQHDKSTRRMPEVVHFGDSLLGDGPLSASSRAHAEWCGHRLRC